MPSTNGGMRVGGVRREVDQQKLGPALLIASSLVLAIRTARWSPTHSDGLANAILRPLAGRERAVQGDAQARAGLNHLPVTCRPRDVAQALPVGNVGLDGDAGKGLLQVLAREFQGR